MSDKLFKILISCLFFGPLLSEEITYKPTYQTIQEGKLRSALSQSVKAILTPPLKTGVDWGKSGSVKQSVYFYMKDSKRPIELRTFTSIKSTFKSQQDMWDKNGFILTSRVQPKPALPLDVNVEFTSNSLIAPQKMGVETTLKLKY